MDGKHTPGPWVVGGTNSPDDLQFRLISAKGGRIICYTSGLSGEKSMTHYENLANASLIARAPELLEENKSLRFKLTAAEDRLRHMESDDEFALMEQENHEWEEHCEELEAENEKLKARIAELEAEREWQPIEKAPRDGAPILSDVGIIRLFGKIWCYSNVDGERMVPIWQDDPTFDTDPTHWMPLPKMEDE